ncbi:MAG: STAS domain-containing protein [Alphaproteobacteria bacterium]|nr:STAS domain-containing protein [Rhodospirillales bacterium]MCW9045006.1 STAS domain-containing protein [Alphaproteobacteria bacterium]
MKISTTEKNGALIVAFEGDVDLEHSPTARKELLAAVSKNSAVIVDLHLVSYIDSSGVACLVESFQTARKNGGTFCLAAVSESALRVLQLARLDKIFTIHTSVDEAIG